MAIATRSLADRLHDRLRVVGDVPSLAAAVFDALPHHVDHDFACFATVDPASGMITWAAKTRSLVKGDEEFAAAEYGPSDVNSFEELTRRQPPVGVLSIDTGGEVDRCRRHRDFMAPQFGFTDELRAVCVSRSAPWGALGIYRGPGDPPFTAADADQIAAVCAPLAQAIQRCLFSVSGVPTASPAAGEYQGPAVIVVGGDGRALQVTPAARAGIEDLGGYDHGSLPENILSVVAATRHRGASVHGRVRSRSGWWLSVRAALLDAADGRCPDVVVTIEPPRVPS